jgi:hypothetical protein
MRGEGVIESFTIDILGVRRQMTLCGSRKISVYSMRHASVQELEGEPM